MRRFVLIAPLLAAFGLAAAFAWQTALPADAQTGAGISISPFAVQVDYDNDAFAVSVELNDLNHEGRITYDTNRDTVPDREEASIGLGAFEIEISFDPRLIEFDSVDAGDFLRSAGRSTQCLHQRPTPGLVSVGCVSFGSGAGPQGSGLLAEIMLRPLANGVSLIGIDASLAGPLGDSIVAGVEGGVVEITGGPEAPPGNGGSSQDPNGDPGNGSDPPPGGVDENPLGAEGTPVDTDGDGTPDVFVNARGTVVPAPDPADSASGSDDDGGGFPMVLAAVLGAVAVVLAGLASGLVLRARRNSL